MNEKNKTSAVDEFFNKLPSEDTTRADIFEGDKPKQDDPSATNPDKGDGEGDHSGEGTEPRKNRRHRQLETKLQQEREANIALNERVKVLSEVTRFAKEHEGEVDPRLLQTFGTTEEGKMFAKIMSQVIADNTAKAREEAIEEMEQRQVAAREEQAQFEKFIDDELEYLEDQYNVDLTSDAPAARKARREFLELVHNVSPKDQEGVITGYADFDKTFELYQKSRQEQKPSSVDRQKEIAARTMQRPGVGSGEPPKPTPGFFGWKRDLKLR